MPLILDKDLSHFSYGLQWQSIWELVYIGFKKILSHIRQQSHSNMIEYIASYIQSSKKIELVPWTCHI